MSEPRFGGEFYVVGGEWGADGRRWYADGRFGFVAASPQRDSALRRAVFLDRDGTLNAFHRHAERGTLDSPMGPEELALLPGAADAVRVFNEIGLLAVVVSNQPVVAKGKTTLARVSATTARLRALLAAEGAHLDAVYYCLHHPDGTDSAYRRRCACRKPGPGMLLQAAADLRIDLGDSYMVGDALTDAVAGRTAGCSTILLQESSAISAEPSVDHTVTSLTDAVELIRADHALASSAGVVSRPA